VCAHRTSNKKLALLPDFGVPCKRAAAECVPHENCRNQFMGNEQLVPAAGRVLELSEVPRHRPRERLASIDAFRGFVMFLMMAEVLRLSRVAKGLPGNEIWQLLAYHQTHVEWVGCSLHDLIQPGFSFLVGVAVPFSIAGRMSRGQSNAWMLLHALWRSLVLVLLGVFLRSVGKPQTYWTFEDTLSQIGLGYPFLFLLGLWSERVGSACRAEPDVENKPAPSSSDTAENAGAIQTAGSRSRSASGIYLAIVLLLAGYWAAWALYPLPGNDFSYEGLNVTADWEHNAHGFAAHWNKNTNAGNAFDQWFLNLFPREKPFVANRGGYLTLSFIPTLATMLLGLIAGRWMQYDLPPGVRVGRMFLAGIAGLALGWGLHALGICPLVKRIWTPTWTIFSGGACFLFMAAFYTLIDWAGLKRWAFPLVVIGANSIFAYVMAHWFEEFIAAGFTVHLGADIFKRLGDVYEPFVRGVCVLTVYWLILFWMYRRRVFLKI
jgi:heparan-alpha-glucosaminide N-acetyltransferase